MAPRSPGFLTLARRGIRYHWRPYLGVLLGVATAAAVLSGALLVGDSVRYSLRRFGILRLGDTRLALDTRDRLVAAGLADRLNAALDETVAPALSLRAVVERTDPQTGRPRRVNRGRLLGVDARFWSLSPAPPPHLEEGGAVLARKTAQALDAAVGDVVRLRVAVPSGLPREAPLADRSGPPSRTVTLTVTAIVPDEALGRFSLSAEQIAPFNVFMRLDELCARLDLAPAWNLALVGGGDAAAIDAPRAQAALRKTWRLDDAGLVLRHAAEQDLLVLESRRIFLAPAAVAAAEAAGGSSVSAYLVEGIDRGGRTTPYAFAAACEPSAAGAGGPVPAGMRDDEILVNRWLANALEAERGDTVTVRYRKLDASGEFSAAQRSFTVHGVIGMETARRERALLPAFPGLTDVERCADWDIGMPMDEERLRDPANQAYWDAYGATPKAFFTFETGRAMWGNHLGAVTSVRWPAAAGGAGALAGRLRAAIDPAALGLRFMPVREQAVRAVAEGLDFGALFAAMSFFLIAAALILTALLFVFGVSQRLPEMGVLLAAGYRRAQVRRLFFLESAGVALAGSAIGAVLGAWYTRGLIHALSEHWQGAVAGAAMRYHAEPGTAAAGAAMAWVCALLTLGLTLRRQARRPAARLLRGDAADEQAAARGTARRAGWLLPLLCAAGAVAAIVAALHGEGENPAAGFFGAGALLLAALLLGGRLLLGRLARRGGRPGAVLSVVELGLRNIARRRGRSLATMTLLACGAFIVVGVSSMQEDVAAHAHRRDSGTGGFELFAQSALAAPDPLEAPRGRRAYALDRDPRLRDVEAVSLKVRDGDDASCLNLNRAQTPVLLGVDPAAMARRGAFAGPGEAGDLWGALEDAPAGGPIPALVGDADTATWGLALPVGPEKGATLEVLSATGDRVRIKLVGKLPMRLSVFQGAVLIPVDAFNRAFPGSGGYRMFLFDCPPERVETVGAALTERLAAIGLDAAPAVTRLRAFYTVEQTYLGMFLVLGGIGLLLGSLGLGVVMVRNMAERRAELAVLQCVGFERRHVARMLLVEHGLLVAAGLAAGAAASGVAVLPALLSANVDVPYRLSLLILAGACAVGLAAAAAAVHTWLRGPLLPALREE